jgi:uncharacterized protein (DUF885 family)
MSDQETRLAVAEMKLAHHDRLHEETQESIKILSEGIAKLVQAEIRREQDQKAFERLFGMIAELRRDFEEYKDRQTEKELAAYRGIVWKLAGLSALVAASVLAGQLGATLIK